MNIREIQCNMDNPLNICIISQEFPPYTNWGGIAAYNNEFANMFSKMGHKVIIVSRMSNGAPEYEKLTNGVEVWRIGHNVFIKRFVGRTIDKMMHSRAVYKKVVELDNQTRFDVIETTEAGLEGELLLQDPAFVSRVVIQCNGSNAQCVIPDGFLSPIHKLDIFWSFRKEQASLKLVPRILATSNATRQFLISNGISSSKINLIYQGIDTDRFQPASAAVPDSVLQVGFVGRFEEPKGIDFIWKVMEKIGPDAGIRFHFKGAIHWTTKKETERKLKQFSKFAVYHSPVGQDEMPAFYQSLQVLLQPSRFENFGLVYVEGMACKLIVFAGKNGGGSEIIKNSVTGFVIDPDNDIDFVVGKLKEIASGLMNFREMANAAREEVIKRFSLQSCAEQKISYYKKLRL
jgi:glycosyltransferase involved in cell wall biosynthesis